MAVQLYAHCICISALPRKTGGVWYKKRPRALPLGFSPMPPKRGTEKLVEEDPGVKKLKMGDEEGEREGGSGEGGGGGGASSVLPGASLVFGAFDHGLPGPDPEVFVIDVSVHVALEDLTVHRTFAAPIPAPLDVFAVEMAKSSHNETQLDLMKKSISGFHAELLKLAKAGRDRIAKANVVVVGEDAYFTHEEVLLGLVPASCSGWRNVVVPSFNFEECLLDLTLELKSSSLYEDDIITFLDDFETFCAKSTSWRGRYEHVVCVNATLSFRVVAQDDE
jgi:hypothetical protein